MERRIRVLMVTCEWPSSEDPNSGIFLVDQVAKLRHLGVQVEVFSFRGAKNPYNYLKAWWRLNRLLNLRQDCFDLVHAQFGQAALICWPKRLPLVITFHGVDLLGELSPEGRPTLRGKLLVRLGRMAARFADAVIVVSNEMRQKLPTTAPVQILPMGVDLASLEGLSREEARFRLGLPRDERLALFVGDPHDPLKRYFLAEQAVALLNRRFPVRLILGWCRSHREILTMMQACDVLVITSLQEGSPTIVKEALACNLPIVSVSVGDVVERLSGIDGCEVVTDDALETIANSIERTLRRECRISAHETIMHLDQKKLTNELIGIYRSILQAPMLS